MDLTLGQLIVKTIILQILFVAIRVVFFDYLNLDLWPIIAVFYLLIVGVTTAVVRRFGDTNWFESFFIIIIWMATGLLVDWLITSKIVGEGYFSNIHLWISYVVMILSVLIFDRKEHVMLRKNM